MPEGPLSQSTALTTPQSTTREDCRVERGVSDSSTYGMDQSTAMRAQKLFAICGMRQEVAGEVCKVGLGGTVPSPG